MPFAITTDKASEIKTTAVIEGTSAPATLKTTNLSAEIVPYVTVKGARESGKLFITFSFAANTAADELIGK